MPAQYQDIFNYTLGNNLPTSGGGENGNVNYTPRDWMSNEEMPGFKYNFAQNDSGNNYWSYDTPDKYQGIINLTNKNDGPNGSAQWDNNYRALPNQGMTKYGPIEDAAPYNPNSKLADPNMYYDDPYYGKITAQKNVLPDKDLMGNLIPKLAMAAGSAWMGSLAVPDLFGGKALWSLGNSAAKMGIGGSGGSGGINMSNKSLYNMSLDGQGPQTLANGANMAENNYGNLSEPDYYSGGGLGPAPGNFSGGGTPGGFLSNVGNSLMNGFNMGDNAGLSGALAGPAAALAYKQYSDAGKYRELGNSAADRSDPFGSQRAGYAQRLYDTYQNPQAVLDDPQHQAVVQKQSNAINSRNRASGYEGSGKNNMDLADYQAQADAQYLGHERDQLGNLAGAQFNPANAGAMMMKGGELAMNSENLALGTAMSPYTAYLQSQYNGNRVQPGGGYPMGSSGGMMRYPGTPGGNYGSVGSNGPQMPNVPTGIGSGTWGGNGYPDPGDGSYGPQLPNVYGPNSGWGQDVMNPPNYGDIYGPGSGWGQDMIGGGSQYIPEGGGEVFDGFDFSNFDFGF